MILAGDIHGTRMRSLLGAAPRAIVRDDPTEGFG
jgi:hypothetical protein